MGNIRKAVFRGDLLDFEPGVKQVGFRRLKLPLDEIALNALPGRFAEDAAEQGAADADPRSEFADAEISGQMFRQLCDGSFDRPAVEFAGRPPRRQRQVAVQDGEELQQFRLPFEFGFDADS
ncbi:MAG TPA: hypothetical protein DFL85_10640 [Lentisphaeria bacterium]|nr:hypothetical protein C5Q97_09730 [Victivallales bacterium CCUG 44730]HBP07509.1 hypothetical protein [Lentisphaeria bacterium]HCH85959.1 hypothetical protein [Lentisphaeria bacterium]